MRERIFVDLRKKHMFLWLWEFWWLVFCENATEQCHELQCALSEPPPSLPLKRNVSKKWKQRSYFSFCMEHTNNSALWKEAKSEKEAFWLCTCSACVFLALTLYDWITNGPFWGCDCQHTLQECAMKTQWFECRINGESTALYRKKSPYTL